MWIYSVQLKLKLGDQPGRQVVGILSSSSLILNGSKVVLLYCTAGDGEWQTELRYSPELGLNLVWCLSVRD